MFGFNCCFLTGTQISQEAGQVVWYLHILKNFPQFVMIHTVKGIEIVNEREIDVFLKLVFPVIQRMLDQIWFLVLFQKLLFFSQMFVTPLQTTLLPCISSSWGCFWSPPPIKYYKPLSIVLQALYLSNLIPWIYLLLPLYNHREFDLGDTWMVSWFSLLSSF